MKESITTAIGYFVAFVFIVLIGMGINMAFNNQTIESKAYTSVSYATWLTGHIEYTNYSAGHQDVKIYPGIGHRLFDSVLYQDLDGDGRVDIIRRNGHEWKWNKLDLLLVRNNDFDSNAEKFIKADEKLKELRDRYK